MVPEEEPEKLEAESVPAAVTLPDESTRNFCVPPYEALMRLVVNPVVAVLVVSRFKTFKVVVVLDAPVLRVGLIVTPLKVLVFVSFLVTEKARFSTPMALLALVLRVCPVTSRVVAGVVCPIPTLPDASRVSATPPV